MSTTTERAGAARLALFPMHGEIKMRREGLRTRDAHLMEWFARSERVGGTAVVSRPEPWPLLSSVRLRCRMRRSGALPSQWDLHSPQPLAAPPVNDRFRWWDTSQRHAAEWPANHPFGVVWNPFARLPRDSGVRIVLDLLDDWSVHSAYTGIRPQVKAQYRRWFDRADAVTANSEGTMALAQRFGRGDAVLLPNGCDPSRFNQVRSARRERFVVGYGGKIGSRVDLELVRACARQLPDVEFQFAGPVLDRDSLRALEAIENIRLLGDIHYADYPSVLDHWDVGWVPHGVGSQEVGGDAIKVYEYRAAGMPVVMTKIIGYDRAPVGVQAVTSAEMIPALRELALAGPGGIPRDRYETPSEHSWAAKADHILDSLGMGR